MKELFKGWEFLFIFDGNINEDMYLISTAPFVICPFSTFCFQSSLANNVKGSLMIFARECVSHLGREYSLNASVIPSNFVCLDKLEMELNSRKIKKEGMSNEEIVEYLLMN